MKLLVTHKKITSSFSAVSYRRYHTTDEVSRKGQYNQVYDHISTTTHQTDKHKQAANICFQKMVNGRRVTKSCDQIDKRSWHTHASPGGLEVGVG